MLDVLVQYICRARQLVLALANGSVPESLLLFPTQELLDAEISFKLLQI